MATLVPGGDQGLNMIATPSVDSRGPGYNNDLVAQNPIGGMMRRDNKLFRYVKFSAGTGTVTPLAGAPAYAKTFTPAGSTTAAPVFTVTADQSDSVMGLQPVGIFLVDATPTDGYYIWIQVGGRHAGVLVAGAVAGDVLIGSASDNTCAKISDGSSITNVPVGRVCGASSSGASPALLFAMDW